MSLNKEIFKREKKNKSITGETVMLCCDASTPKSKRERKG